MKKIYLQIISCMLICNAALAQAPKVDWQKCLGGKYDDIGNVIKQTTDGNFILAGNTYSKDGDVKNIKGASDCWVVKLNKSNDIEWQITIGGSYDEYSNDIIQTSDGGYLLVGSTYSFDYDIPFQHGASDILVVKLNKNGKTEWIRTYGGSNTDEPASVIETKKGDFVIVGNTYSNNGDVSGNHGGYDVWVLNITKDGFINGQQCMGGFQYDRGSNIVQTKDGGFILSATTYSSDGDVYGNHGNADIWLIKTNAGFGIEWQKCFGGTGQDYAGNVIVSSDGGYVLAGITDSYNGDVTNNKGSFDVWLIKCKNNGNLEWQKTFGGKGEEGYFYTRGTAVVYETADNGYFFASGTYSDNKDVKSNHGLSDFWFVKLNNKKDIEWQRSLGGTQLENMWYAIPTNEGGYAAVGTTKSIDGDVTGLHSKAYWDIWVAKIKSENIAANKPAALQQLQVTPNPAQYFIKFNAPGNGMVTITSTNGNVMLSQKISAGPAQFNIGSFTRGEYNIRLVCDKTIYGQKFIKQ